MKKQALTFDEQKCLERKAVADFLAFYREHADLAAVIYETWTAKDVLAHIASWHMSFSRNLLDAVNDRAPAPFTGSLTEINEREVQALSGYSVTELMEKIRKAQEEIEAHIDNPAVQLIAYRKGSRPYSPIEHLEVVRRHITSHLSDVLKKYKSPGK